jgi:hypothetical protein
MKKLCVGFVHGLYQSRETFAQMTHVLRARLSPELFEAVIFEGTHKATPPVLRSGSAASPPPPPPSSSSLPAAESAATAARQQQQTSSSSRDSISSGEGGGGDSSHRKPRPLVTADQLNLRGWWTPAAAPAVVAEETAQTLRALGEQLRAHRVDGLVGFSQGGALAALLCTQEGIDLVGWSPSFVVCCSAYASEAPWHRQLLESGIERSVASLHVAGAVDKVVPLHKSRHLSQLFHLAEFVDHGIGHRFPTDADTVGRIAEFIEQQRLRLSISCPR